MINPYIIGVVGLASLGATMINGYLALTLIGVGFLLSLIPSAK